MTAENERLRLSHTLAELAFQKPTTIPRYRKVAGVMAIQLESDVEIETREGWLKADKGDYLVMNDIGLSPIYGGWPWPVKKEIFERTYRKE